MRADRQCAVSEQSRPQAYLAKHIAKARKAMIRIIPALDQLFDSIRNWKSANGGIRDGRCVALFGRLWKSVQGAAVTFEVEQLGWTGDATVPELLGVRKVGRPGQAQDTINILRASGTAQCDHSGFDPRLHIIDYFRRFRC